MSYANQYSRGLSKKFLIGLDCERDFHNLLRISFADFCSDNRAFMPSYSPTKQLSLIQQTKEEQENKQKKTLDDLKSHIKHVSNDVSKHNDFSDDAYELAINQTSTDSHTSKSLDKKVLQPLKYTVYHPDLASYPTYPCKKC